MILKNKIIQPNTWYRIIFNPKYRHYVEEWKRCLIRNNYSLYGITGNVPISSDDSDGTIIHARLIWPHGVFDYCDLHGVVDLEILTDDEIIIYKLENNL